ncbi:molybdopterin-guanine dinucleotide biosynthesis protein B [Pantoea agglomerans]|uniref:molybdopterin-guanine dinucleotide biosynthesis protein MobB n=1 Tax=Enterobacter agglomerans TaxID=549 RepID=UPI001A8D66E1|nr:molybdopterin-guanine dinucleotide biosynthesis protein MobB [Pantoea agglomerans]MBN9931107.1 molybdopterin-guanine dinucleotide biosynthesis protein B [Pantoea agglomerans]
MSLPILAIVGWSGTGKTTLLQQVLPILGAKGIRAGLIKHTHHQMDVDTPGKDSYLLRKAGASQVIVASSERWALMCETPEKQSINLPYLLSRMDHATLEVVLVEGFKDEPVPKIVLWRAGIKGGIEELLDEQVIAVASDQKLTLNVPVLDINRPYSVADFIADWLEKG